MDPNKFCFIICSNNEVFLAECEHYLAHLEVPDGYGTDLVVVTDAKSMTSGYNEAMAATNAKYKIYLHQDVFVLNRHFLGDLLKIFRSDPKIGMVGMVGYERMSPDGMMWHEPRVGGVYLGRRSRSYPERESYRYSLENDGYSEVVVTDGLLLATSVDLPWDEEYFDGWDFYDALQSVVFRESGYRIVVPVQRYPWVLHDDGGILNLEHYDHYRKIFMERYARHMGESVAR